MRGTHRPSGKLLEFSAAAESHPVCSVSKAQTGAHELLVHCPVLSAVDRMLSRDPSVFMWVKHPIESVIDAVEACASFVEIEEVKQVFFVPEINKHS